MKLQASTPHPSSKLHPSLASSQTDKHSAQDSWRLSSLISTITFGWLGSNQELSEDGNSQTDCDNTVTNELASDTKELERVKVIDENLQRKLRFKQELSKHLKSHSEERLSQLPVVGLSPRGPSGVSMGMKLFNKASHLKSRVLTRLIEATEFKVQAQQCFLTETEQNECCGLIIADLACLEMESHDHTCVADSAKEGDWFQFKVCELDQSLCSLSNNKSNYVFNREISLGDRPSITRATHTHVRPHPWHRLSPG